MLYGGLLRALLGNLANSTLTGSRGDGLTVDITKLKAIEKYTLTYALSPRTIEPTHMILKDKTNKKGGKECRKLDMSNAEDQKRHLFQN